MMHWKRTLENGRGICLLAIVCLAPPTVAQVLNEIGHFGESIATVAVDGNRGVFNEGTHVRVMDITDPSAPTFHGSVDLGVVPTQLFLVGDTAYSASHTAGLHIIDITNMDAPTVLSFRAGRCWYDDVWVRGVQDYAYLVQCGSVAVYDVRDKTNPVLVRELTELQQCSYGVTGDGGYLYASESGSASAVHIWSLADPANPVYMSGLDMRGTANTRGSGIAAFGDTLYLGQADGTRVVDIRDRTSPGVVRTLTSSFNDALATNRGVLQVGNYNSLWLWALASPTAPDFLSQNSMYPPNLVTQMAAQGNYNFSVHSHTLFITDVTQSPPLIVASHTITSGFNTVRKLARIGTTLLVGMGPGLASLDISNPTAPQLLQTTGDGFTTDLKAVGTLLYRLTSLGLLEVWDAVNPSSLQMLANYPMQTGEPGNVYVDGTRLAAVSAGELKLFEVGVDGLLTEQSVLTPAGDAHAVALRDSAMYVLPTDGNLLVYEVSNLTNPVLQPPISIGVPSSPGLAGDLEAEGDRLHVFSARRGYILLDIADRLAPTILGSFDDTLLEAPGLSVVGNTIYLATIGWCGKWGVRALDISSPAQITELSAVNATSFAQDVLAYNDVVYVAELDGGLRIRSGVPSGAAGRWDRFQ